MISCLLPFVKSFFKFFQTSAFFICLRCLSLTACIYYHGPPLLSSTIFNFFPDPSFCVQTIDFPFKTCDFVVQNSSLVAIRFWSQCVAVLSTRTVTVFEGFRPFFHLPFTAESGRMATPRQRCRIPPPLLSNSRRQLSLTIRLLFQQLCSAKKRAPFGAP